MPQRYIGTVLTARSWFGGSMTWLFEAPKQHDDARTPRARSRHQRDRPLVEPAGAGPSPNRTRSPGCGPVGTRSASRSAAVGAVPLHLVARSSPDALAGPGHFRELVAAVWHPARNAGRHPVVPWMPADALGAFLTDAGFGDLNPLTSLTAGHAGAPPRRSGRRLPVVVFPHDALDPGEAVPIDPAGVAARLLRRVPAPPPGPPARRALPGLARRGLAPLRPQPVR